MIVNHDDLIENGLFEKLIDALNVLQEGETIVVYLSTKGGSNAHYEIILDLVNKHIDRFMFIFYGDCLSNGFRLALNLKCKKSCLQGITVMAHQSSYSGFVFLDGGTTLPPIIKKEYLIEYKRILKEVSSALTTSQIKEFKNMEDVYISYNQFKKIIK